MLKGKSDRWLCVSRQFRI